MAEVAKWQTCLPAGRRAGFRTNMFYVYILKSLKDNEFHKGLTNNLERRLRQHLKGKVNFTKNRLPLQLIHVEICETREEARKMEKFFKSGYGREVIKEFAEVAKWQTRMV